MFKVETNICYIDEHYINSGAVCIVNCQGISNIMGLVSQKSSIICDKYNIRFLSTNIFVRLYDIFSLLICNYYINSTFIFLSEATELYLFR